VTVLPDRILEITYLILPCCMQDIDEKGVASVASFIAERYGAYKP